MSCAPHTRRVSRASLAGGDRPGSYLVALGVPDVTGRGPGRRERVRDLPQALEWVVERDQLGERPLEDRVVGVEEEGGRDEGAARRCFRRSERGSEEVTGSARPGDRARESCGTVRPHLG